MQTRFAILIILQLVNILHFRNHDESKKEIEDDVHENSSNTIRRIQHKANHSKSVTESFFSIVRKMLKIIAIYTIFFTMSRVISSGYTEANPSSSCLLNATMCMPEFAYKMAPHILIKYGKEQDFVCLPKKSKYPTNVTWEQDGKDLNYKTEKWTLEKVQLRNEGNYTCRVCNEFGCINHTTQLELLNKLSVTTPLQNGTVRIGNQYTFQFKHELSDDDITIEWFPHTAEKIIPNDDGQVTEEQLEKKSLNHLNSTEYRILNATEKDEGWYFYRLSNNKRVAYSSAYLTVLPEDTGGVGTDNKWIVYSILPIIAILVLFFYWVVMCKKGEKKQRGETVWNYFKRKTVDKKLYPERKFSRDDIDLEDGILGTGNFGIVRKALVKENSQSNIKTTAAVKMANGNADLLTEIEMMSRIGHHDNIIDFLGSSEVDGQLWVLMEYAPLGNLRGFLNECDLEAYKNSNGYTSSKKYTVTKLELLGFARQIAEAMEFLASKKIVHRDLAARNVLVTEKRVMKVADFGLTRYTHDKDYYRRQTEGGIPYKWTAPEAFRNKIHTTQSDVWSFGIVLWEIMTLGDEPYVGMETEEVYEEIMNNKLRLPIPPVCLKIFGELMMKCWKEKPKDRPKFGYIWKRLKNPSNDEIEMIGHLSEHTQQRRSSFWHSTLKSVERLRKPNTSATVAIEMLES